MMLLLLLAALPFGVKALTIAAGLWGYGLQSLYKIPQLLVPAAWRFMHGERGWSVVWPVSEPRPSWRLLLVAVGFSCAFTGTAIALILMLSEPFGMDPMAIRAGMDLRFAASPLAAVLIVAFLAVVNSALEELHFRVWLDREIAKRMGDAAGIAVSAFLFSAMHCFIILVLPVELPNLIVALITIGLALAGTCWSFILRRPGGAHAAWLSHGLTDALLLGWGLFWLGYL